MSNSKKKTIMKKCFVMVAAISSMMALSGCSEQVNNEVITEEISWGIPENQGLLRVQTRSATPLQEGKVYVFNSEGHCVEQRDYPSRRTDYGGSVNDINRRDTDNGE